MEKYEESQPITTWKHRIDNWKVSGLSIAKWCEQQQVPYCQFIYWKDKVKGKKRKTRKKQPFIELDDVVIEPGIVVECGHVQIHLQEHFDEKTFLRCVKALRSL